MTDFEPWQPIRPPIGGGTFAEVFKATHTETPNRHAALKCLRVEHLANRRIVSLFRDEARLYDLLGSGAQNIHSLPGYLGGDGSGRRPWIALEFVEGMDLEVLLDRHTSFDGNPLPPAGPQREPLVRKAGLAIAEALVFAHRRGIVHRDIKPSNVQVTPKGRFVLIDFGVARDARAKPLVNQRGAEPYTPRYAAPEQILGKIDEAFEWAVDVYSLGCTMFELLTGDLPDPTHGMAKGRVRWQPRSEPLDPGASLEASDLDPTLRRLMIACTQPDPGMRPSVGQIVGVLHGQERMVRMLERMYDLPSPVSPPQAAPAPPAATGSPPPPPPFSRPLPKPSETLPLEPVEAAEGRVKWRLRVVEASQWPTSGRWCTLRDLAIPGSSLPWELSVRGAEILHHGPDGPGPELLVPANAGMDSWMAAWVLLRPGGPPAQDAAFRALCDHAVADAQGHILSNVKAGASLGALLDALRRRHVPWSGHVAAQAFRSMMVRLFDETLSALRAGCRLGHDPILPNATWLRSARADLAADADVYRAQDAPRLARFRGHLSVGGSKVPLSLAVLEHPKSFRFRDWIDLDPVSPGGKGYTLRLVRSGDLWVLSVHPARRIWLGHLAERLNAAERQSRSGSLPEPWYDGSRHAGTLVASPWSGTQLTGGDIVEAIRPELHLRPWMPA